MMNYIVIAVAMLVAFILVFYVFVTDDQENDIGYLVDEENDKEVYEALGQEGLSAILGGSIIGNSIISPIVSTLFGGHGDIGTPMSKILTQDFRKLSKGDWDDAVIDGISATVPIVGLKNLVGETRGGYRTATGETPEERWSGLRQLFGRSENFANERAGIKKVEKNEGK